MPDLARLIDPDLRRVQKQALTGWQGEGQRASPGDALDPAGWSLYLGLADVRAAQGDFAAAPALAEQGPRHERKLIALAPRLTSAPYRGLLIGYACAGPGLPPGLVAEARRLGTA